MGGFDINSLTEDEIEKLVTASKQFFKNDYNKNNDNKNTTKEGSVYLKFIVMTVTEWINACQSLLDEQHGLLRSPRERKFAMHLKEKLERGIEENWWKENDSFSMPYIGESSSQTFKERMENAYPSIFYSFGKQNGAKAFELKIATIEHGNTIQSRALESFVATLLSQCTMLSRAKKSSCHDYINCQCLRHDCSAFNDVICGDRIGYSSSGNGYDINRWFQCYCDRYRNELIMGCSQRNVAVLAFVIQREPDICYYVNNTPRENAESRSVRENNDAPTHPRNDRNDITVEDACRYFGYLVGSKMVENQIGIHDPEKQLEWTNNELEQMYQRVRDAYQDSSNFTNGTFFPPHSDQGMIKCFRAIRDVADKTYNLTTRNYRLSYWLSKEEELEHLLHEDLYEEANKKKLLVWHHGENAGWMENLERENAGLMENMSRMQEGKDNDDDSNKNQHNDESKDDTDTGVRNNDDNDNDVEDDEDSNGEDWTNCGVTFYLE